MTNRAAKTAQYAVLLHGYNLVIPSSSGEECVGGVRTWRYVRASNASQAVRLAVALLEQDANFLDHVRNPADFPPAFEATKVIALEGDELLDGDGTGLVFYIDPDEQVGH